MAVNVVIVSVSQNEWLHDALMGNAVFLAGVSAHYN